MLVILCDNVPYVVFYTKFVPVYDVKNGEFWCFTYIPEFPVALSSGIDVFNFFFFFAGFEGNIEQG